MANDLNRSKQQPALKDNIENGLRTEGAIARLTGLKLAPSAQEVRNFYRDNRKHFMGQEIISAARVVKHFSETRNEEQTRLALDQAVSELPPTDPKQVPALSNIYTTSNPIPSGWNNGDDPTLCSRVYGSGASLNNWKPGLQAWFKNRQDGAFGQIENCDTVAWTQFLNDYFWMQSAVDFQIGVVMKQLAFSETYNGNTVVVFTSDHGDYGGSHNMHTKGGGLYDEAVKVPLYVSWPGQRQNSDGTTKYSATDGSMPIQRNNLVSGVDLFPFFLALGTGSEKWRTATGPAGKYKYLAKRESIADMTFFTPPTLHRTLTDVNGKTLQYLIHTTDEYDFSDATIPNHAICFRTHGVNTSEEKKLGIYSFWAFCQNSPSYPTQPPVVLGSSTDQSQCEFYDLTSDPGETNNLAVYSYTPSSKHTDLGTGTDATNHLNYFNSIAPCELYATPRIYAGVGGTYATALAAFLSSGYGLSCSFSIPPSASC